MAFARGQQGVELLVIFSAALAVFVIFYAVFAQQYGDSVRRQAQADGISLADSIAWEINIAARAGDGYQRQVSYAGTIGGVSNYSLLINNVSGSVDLTMNFAPGNSYQYTSPLLTRNVTGERQFSATGGFTLQPERGYMFVENREGQVFVSQLRVG